MNRVAVLSAVLVFTLSACQNTPWGRGGAAPPVEPSPAGYDAPPPSEPGLQLSTEQRFADVPLPMNVREDLERSFVYESSSLQIGRMVYTTRASLNELSSFYIRECPASGWELRNVVQAHGAELNFSKPGKRLKVNITDLGIGRGGRQLVITLVPDNS